MTQSSAIVYVLCPGYVVSRTDGQAHYVEASELSRLYGLRPTDRVMILLDTHGYRRLPDEIILEPRSDGNYYDVHKLEGIGL